MNIEKIMNKVRRRTLVILIILLSIAIISLLAYMFINKKWHLPLVALENSLSSSEKAPLVIIDPGHGGWEPGAINGSVQEKDVTLAISLKVEKLIKEKNISYYMLRSTDTYLSLEDRVSIANDKACKLFISIHNNSFKSSDQRGILTAYNPNSSVAMQMAEIMQSKLSKLGMQNRKIMPRPNLYVLKQTEMAALLLEIGFISNKSDLKLITNVDFQQKCADKIVAGIEEIVAKYFADEVESPATN